MTTQDQVMEFSVDDIEGVDQSTVESNEVQFPIVQWAYGDPKLKQLGGMPYKGGWFISETMAPADLSEYGWEKTVMSHDDGSETEGYWAEQISISVIRDRRRWEVQDSAERRNLNFAWKDYEAARAIGSPKGRSHVLVIIQGLEEFGPFCLTLKGTAGLHFNGSGKVKGALSMFDGVVLRAANELSKKAGKKGVWPRRAFWLTVGRDQDAKGNPNFTVVGQGDNSTRLVVPVAIGLPEKHTEVNLGEFYVGKALLDRTQEIYNDVEPWATAWDDIKPGEGNEDSGGDTAGGTATTVTEDDAGDLGL